MGKVTRAQAFVCVCSFVCERTTSVRAYMMNQDNAAQLQVHDSHGMTLCCGVKDLGTEHGFHGSAPLSTKEYIYETYIIPLHSHVQYNTSRSVCVLHMYVFIFVPTKLALLYAFICQRIIICAMTATTTSSIICMSKIMAQPSSNNNTGLTFFGGGGSVRYLAVL